MARPNFLVARLKRLGISKQLLKIYIAIFFAMLSSAFSITMLFPFLPFMVEFLLPDITEESVGKYAGYIASSMFFGRIIGSYVWGSVADHKGRKPVVVISSVLIGLSSAAFGFSVHFAMAVVMRLLVGLTNGVVGTAKAVISEASDDRNQAFGISLIASAWGLGFVIGPAVSGALADPIGQYNLTISNAALHGFLTRFPYSPPCLVNFLLCIVSAIVTYFLLPETRGVKKNRKRSELTKLEEFQRQHSVEPPTSQHQSCETTSLASNTNSASTTADDDNDDQATLLNRGSDSMDSPQRLISEEATGDVEMQCLSGLAGRGPSASRLQSVDDDGSLQGSGENEFDNSTSRTSGIVIVNTGFASFTSLENEDFSENTECERTRVDTENVALDDIIARPEPTSTDGDNESESVDDERQLIEDQGSVEELVPDNGSQDGQNYDDEVMVKKSLAAKIGQSIKRSLLDLKLFLCDRVTLLALMIYSTFSFAVIGFDETYSLWAYTQPYLGGLGFSLHEIGISLSVVGAFLLPFSLFLFALMEKYLGSIKTFYIACSTLMFCVVLLPTVHYLIPTGLVVLLWLLLCSVHLLMRIAMVTCFSACFMIINNSVTFDQLGAVNGLAITITSMFRTVSPVFYGSVYSLSLSPSSQALGFPFNHNFIFVIFGVVFLFTIAMATCLPKSINSQKIIEDE